MKEALKRLKKYLKFDRAQDIFLQVFEILLGLFSGTLWGALITADSPSNWLKYGTIICTAVFIIFIIIRVLKLSYTPSNAVDYLIALDELENKARELERKKIINEYIDKAIQSLNTNTCPLTDSQTERLCETPLEESLSNLLESVIKMPHYMLDCDRAKYTVAIHLTVFPSIKNIDKIGKEFVDYNSRTITFRDDFNLSEYLTEDILDDLNADNLKLEIHTVARAAYNNFKLVEGVLNDNGLKVISSPIPAICEYDKIGVLLIFCDKCITRPNDIDNVLLIFGRLVANWISKYDECLNNRIIKSQNKQLG